MPSVSERVTRVVATELRIAESSVNPATHFVEDLGVDSLGRTRLIMALESEFSCNILDSDVDAIRKVGELITYIEGRITA